MEAMEPLVRDWVEACLDTGLLEEAFEGETMGDIQEALLFFQEEELVPQEEIMVHEMEEIQEG